MLSAADEVEIPLPAESDWPQEGESERAGAETGSGGVRQDHQSISPARTGHIIPNHCRRKKGIALVPRADAIVSSDDRESVTSIEELIVITQEDFALRARDIRSESSRDE